MAVYFSSLKIILNIDGFSNWVVVLFILKKYNDF